MRKFARLNTRTGGKGSDAWDIHFRATELQQQGHETIILTVGQELDGVAPGQAVDVAIAGLHSRRYMYSDINGEVGLRQAIAENFTRESGVAIDETNCAIFSGAQNCLFTTSLCILETGDEVILIEPFYVTYPATFTVGGAKLVQIPTRAAEQLSVRPGHDSQSHHSENQSNCNEFAEQPIRNCVRLGKRDGACKNMRAKRYLANQR